LPISATKFVFLHFFYLELIFFYLAAFFHLRRAAKTAKFTVLASPRRRSSDLAAALAVLNITKTALVQTTILTGGPA
jgi:hypothetical protein